MGRAHKDCNSFFLTKKEGTPKCLLIKFLGQVFQQLKSCKASEQHAIKNMLPAGASLLTVHRWMTGVT